VYDDSNIGLLVILVNSIYLLASSLLIILIAVSYSGLLIVVTVIISLLFLASQFQELALANCILSALNQSATILLIQIHGSHMLLGTSILIGIVTSDSYTGYEDSLLEFVIVYWHLIELVWITLLTGVFNL